MMNSHAPFWHSSIGKKQVIAVTGLLLIFYVILHLAGNLFFFAGPLTYNGYAQKLTGLRPGLYVIEAALLAVFVVHLYMTALLVLENIRARGGRCRLYRPKGGVSLSARLMPWSGIILFAFVAWHLWDFTFADKSGPRSILSDGHSYGLYGVVYNAFCDPAHSLFYVAAMAALGLHLTHGLESFVQTFGWLDPRFAPVVRRVSQSAGLLVAIGYSSLPAYVLLNHWS